MAIATMPELSHQSVSLDFEKVYRQFSPMIYRTARAVTGNAEDAEDVLQTLFLRLMRQEYSGNAQFKRNPHAYLYRAAVNLSFDLLRARRRRTFTHEVERLEAPRAQGADRFDDDLHARLQAALEDLSPEAAHILVLRYVHNYSDAEISELLGTSRGAIALRLFRLRARLKKQLGRRT